MSKQNQQKTLDEFVNDPEALTALEPEECSPEQIEECYGENKEHPCTEEAEQKEQ